MNRKLAIRATGLSAWLAIFEAVASDIGGETYDRRGHKRRTIPNSGASYGLLREIRALRRSLGDYG